MNLNQYPTYVTLQPRSFVYAIASNVLVVESASSAARMWMLHAGSQMSNAVVLQTSNHAFQISRGEKPLAEIGLDARLGVPRIAAAGNGFVQGYSLRTQASVGCNTLRKAIVVADCNTDAFAGGIDSDHLFAGIGYVVSAVGGSNVSSIIYQSPNAQTAHVWNHGLASNSSREMMRVINVHKGAASNGEWSTFLGIGTSSPAYALDVNGDIHAAGTLFASNIDTGSNPVYFTSLIAGGLSIVAPTSNYNSNLGTFTYGTVPVFSITPTGIAVLASNTNSYALFVNGQGYVSSNLTIGTTTSGGPPLIVSSSQMVSNLNVQYLGGLPSSFYLNATNLSTGTLSSNLLPATGVAAGTYGNASNLVMLRFDSIGRASFASNIPLWISPSQIVGGALASNLFPVSGVAAGTYGSISNVVQFTVDATGRVLFACNLTPPLYNILNAAGYVNAALLPSTGVTSNTYGGRSNYVTFTVDSTGRVTWASNILIKDALGLATSAYIDATNMGNVTKGVLPVVYGGTGRSSHLNERLLIGNGANGVYSCNLLVYNPVHNYLGIGTSNPTSTMDIAGNINFTGLLTWCNIPVPTGYYINNYQWCNVSHPTLLNKQALLSPGDVVVAGNLYVKGAIVQQVTTAFVADPWPPGSSGNATINNTYIGSTSNALTDAMWSNVAKLAFPLPIALGGAGSNTWTSNQLLLGNGTDAFYQTADLSWDRANARLGVRTTAPEQALHVNGKIFANDSISSLSDARFKTNVHTIGDAVEIVRALRGVRYNRIDTGERCVGVIAQEVEAVLPEVVVQNASGKSVNYANMVGVLIEAVKRLDALVMSHQQTIEVLLARTLARG